MKVASSARTAILSLGLLGAPVGAFAPSSSTDALASSLRRSDGRSASATRLDAASLAAASREEDLSLTRKIIMERENGSAATAASGEDSPRETERPSAESTLAEAPEPRAAVASVSEDKDFVDVSVPYDAAAKLAYESYRDKAKASFEAFEAKYLADAVADVKSKRAKEATEISPAAAVETPAAAVVVTPPPPPPPSSSSSSSSASASFFDADPSVREKQLIERTKRLFDADVKLGLADGGDCLAEDFEFCAAVVGPIGKKAFLEALGGFKLEDSFAIEQNRFGYAVSPAQPNRVYFLTSNKATMTKDFMGVAPEDSPNRELVLPPECHHADFDEETGKLTEYGFYTVDRQFGNTGGLGGAFGFFYGVGKALPFPEARPFKKSIAYALFTWIGNRMSKNRKNDDASA